MVPAAFIGLEALPLTPNGKVDRAALPEPIRAPSLGDVAPVEEPRTSVEEILVRIWSSVLGVGSVDTHDNFFDLGGNSLHAMMIISRAVSALKVEVSIAGFFEIPTVAHMAELVGSANLKDHQDPEMAAMLDMVESLSEEGANQLLKKETIE